MDGDYVYRDTYFGGQKFTGGERVWIKDNIVWAMNYYGQSLNEMWVHSPPLGAQGNFDRIENHDQQWANTDMRK